MLLVNTFTQISLGKGIGLFASNEIPMGTKYWSRNELFDKVFSPWQLSRFKQINRVYVKRYGFLEVSGNWYLCGDNARFSNHADIPNTKNFFDSKGILQYCTFSQNIAAGEEILCDYREICQTCKSGVNFMSL